MFWENFLFRLFACGKVFFSGVNDIMEFSPNSKRDELVDILCRINVNLEDKVILPLANDSSIPRNRNKPSAPHKFSCSPQTPKAVLTRRNLLIESPHKSFLCFLHTLVKCFW